MSGKSAAAPGTSVPLTEKTAAAVFEGLLSAEEDTETPETQPDDDNAVIEGADAPEPTEEESDDAASAEGDEPVDDEAVDDEEQSPTPRKYKVKADGQDLEVDEAELIKGYSRTADYTRKTQELAEKRKAHEAEETAVRAERQRYATDLVQLEDALKAAVPSEPDWAKIQKDAPETFADTYAQWQLYQNQIARVSAEKDAAIAKVYADQRAAHNTVLEGERVKLLEALPEWSKPDVAKKEKGEMVEFAKSLGYTQDEVNAVYDHRLIKLLRAAMLHDRAAKAKPDVQAKIDRVKVATPGTPKTPVKGKQIEIAKAQSRLKKSGSVNDAAAVFQQLLD